MNKNKSQLTLYLKGQTPNNLILIVNDGVSEGPSLASSVVASVPSVGFIALRPLRQLRQLRCVHCVLCVGWKPSFTPKPHYAIDHSGEAKGGRVPPAFSRLFHAPKCVCGRGSAPLVWGASSAPSDRLVGGDRALCSSHKPHRSFCAFCLVAYDRSKCLLVH